MDSTALIDAFLAESKELTRNLPFTFLPEAGVPFDVLALPPLVYLRWAASRNLLVDSPLARKIIESASPEHAMDHIRATLGDQIHLHALVADAQAFSNAYYCSGRWGSFLCDFVGLFAHFGMGPADVGWEQLTAAQNLIDGRFQEWQNGDPWKPADDPRFAEVSSLVDTPAAAMLPEAWIAQLAQLSANVRNDASSRAYAEHFHAPVVGPPTDAMLQATFREFCRSPRHDTSMMQSAVNLLGVAPLPQYARVYAKVLPKLLAADPDIALCMFNYPGQHLCPEQVDHLVTEIVRAHPSSGVLTSLALVAISMNAADDEPFDALVAAAGVR